MIGPGSFEDFTTHYGRQTLILEETKVFFRFKIIPFSLVLISENILNAISNGNASVFLFFGPKWVDVSEYNNIGLETKVRFLILILVESTLTLNPKSDKRGA